MIEAFFLKITLRLSSMQEEKYSQKNH